MTSERLLQRPGVQLCLLALLCLAVKAGLVLSLADVFFYGEELEKGTAAKAMLDGLDVPHHQLAYHYYEAEGSSSATSRPWPSCWWARTSWLTSSWRWASC